MSYVHLQTSVDEEVSTVVQKMLLVLLDCFTNLTERSEKVHHSVVRGSTDYH